MRFSRRRSLSFAKQLFTSGSGFAGEPREAGLIGDRCSGACVVNVSDGQALEIERSCLVEEDLKPPNVDRRVRSSEKTLLLPWQCQVCLSCFCLAVTTRFDDLPGCSVRIDETEPNLVCKTIVYKRLFLG
jgi:hypothetical protein